MTVSMQEAPSSSPNSESGSKQLPHGGSLKRRTMVRDIATSAASVTRDCYHLIAGKIDWYDEGGVPRYKPYHPELGGIYDRYSAPMLIQCQACGEEFMVARQISSMETARFGPDTIVYPTPDDVGHFHYGDPPRYSSCVGDTMNCIDVQIVEFWERLTGFSWQRRPEHEIIFDVSEWETYDNARDERHRSVLDAPAGPVASPGAEPVPDAGASDPPVRRRE